MSDIDENFCKFIIIFLLIIPHEVVCKHFAYFLEQKQFQEILGKFQENFKEPDQSLMVRTMCIVCTIHCQRLFVPNLIFIVVVLEKGLKENSSSKSFFKTGEVINKGFFIKLHGKLCLTACLKKAKILIGKHFFRYFKEYLGTHLTHISPVWLFMQKSFICFALQIR